MNNAGTRGCPFVTLSITTRRKQVTNELEYPILSIAVQKRAFFFERESERETLKMGWEGCDSEKFINVPT